MKLYVYRFPEPISVVADSDTEALRLLQQEIEALVKHGGHIDIDIKEERRR